MTKSLSRIADFLSTNVTLGLEAAVSPVILIEVVSIPYTEIDIVMLICVPVDAHSFIAVII
jgi:hypothetical protein